MSKLVAIRLPDDLYDAIASIGKEKFPKKPNKKTDNDFDVSAVIVHLLRDKLDLPDNVSPSIIQDVKQSFDEKLTELRSELTRVETEGYMTAKNLEKSEQKISELETKFSKLREALDDKEIISKLAQLIKRVESLEDTSESAIAANSSELENKISELKTVIDEDFLHKCDLPIRLIEGVLGVSLSDEVLPYDYQERRNFINRYKAENASLINQITSLTVQVNELKEAFDKTSINPQKPEVIETSESATKPEVKENSEGAIAAEASEVEQKILDSIEAINSINEQSIASKKKEKLPTKKEIFAKEVLSLLEQGLSYQKIADQIGISKSLVSQIVTEKKKT
jgi:predicted XRE-type DNA-binding protein